MASQPASREGRGELTADSRQRRRVEGGTAGFLDLLDGHARVAKIARFEGFLQGL